MIKVNRYEVNKRKIEFFFYLFFFPLLIFFILFFFSQSEKKNFANIFIIMSINGQLWLPTTIVLTNMFFCFFFHRNLFISWTSLSSRFIIDNIFGLLIFSDVYLFYQNNHCGLHFGFLNKTNKWIEDDDDHIIHHWLFDQF